MLTFLVKNGKMKLSGNLHFEKTRKNFKYNLVLVAVLVFESKGLYSCYVLFASFVSELFEWSACKLAGQAKCNLYYKQTFNMFFKSNPLALTN